MIERPTDLSRGDLVRVRYRGRPLCDMVVTQVVGVGDWIRHALGTTTRCVENGVFVPIETDFTLPIEGEESSDYVWWRAADEMADTQRGVAA